MKGLANKSKYKQNQVEIQDVSRSLRESTKNLCRNLKDNPNISGNLMKIQQERESLQDLLIRTIQNLEDGTFQTLISQVDADRAEQAKLEGLVRREKETAAAVKQLKEDLLGEQEEHTRELAARKKKIAELKEELQMRYMNMWELLLQLEYVNPEQREIVYAEIDDLKQEITRIIDQLILLDKAEH